MLISELGNHFLENWFRGPWDRITKLFHFAEISPRVGLIVDIVQVGFGFVDFFKKGIAFHLVLHDL